MKIRYVVLDENLSYDSVAAYAIDLPPYRREKIARYRYDADKLRSLVAGLLLHQVIGDRLVLFGAHEKPYVAEEGLCFSLSHSGEIVAIAVDERPIGLDVEAVPDEDRLKIADRFYHLHERDSVRQAEQPTRAFCRIWTRKEAYLKMTGEGISTDLTAFDTTSLPLSAQLYTTDLDGYCLSVCSERAIGEKDVDISEMELKELLSPR